MLEVQAPAGRERWATLSYAHGPAADGVGFIQVTSEVVTVKGTCDVQN